MEQEIKQVPQVVQVKNFTLNFRRILWIKVAAISTQADLACIFRYFYNIYRDFTSI